MAPPNRATPCIAAAGHSPSSAMGERPCRRPRPPFLPGRSRRGRSSSGDAFSQEIPTTGEDFQCPGRPPETILPNTPFPKSKERMLGCWGVPEAGIRARSMSISRALGAEKPAAKRPRSYMEGPCGRKLSIMSTVCPTPPLKNPKNRC